MMLSVSALRHHLYVRYIKIQLSSSFGVSLNKMDGRLNCDNNRKNVSKKHFDGQNEGDREENNSYMKRARWTDTMVKLLITVVSYTIGGTSLDLTVAQETTSDSRIGKWKAISKVMCERGFLVSAQQCEDKFNDVNKKYKRLHKILGKGTCCNIVDDPRLLATIDLPLRVKREVMKILNSEQLFYREMCSYHNGNRLFLPHDWTLHRSLQVALRGKNKFGESDELRKSNGAKRSKRLREDEGEGLCNASNITNLRDPHLHNHHAHWKKQMMSRLLHLQEMRARNEEKMLELENIRLEWLRTNKREDMKLAEMRLENVRMKLENARLEAGLKLREMSG